MRAKLTIAIAALQLVVLAYMAGEREWVVRTGRTIYLRTAPLDPRDAMRGDYVSLSYDISRVPRDLWPGGLAATNPTTEELPRDTKVYAALRTSPDGVAELTALSLQPPASGLFIRGRTEGSWVTALPVRYGLEAYFMEQGRGLELERGQNREGIRVPLEMETAVSPGGLAVLKGYRWCALGIGLDLVSKEEPAVNGQRRRRNVGATVRLLNASSNDVAVVDLPGRRSLALVPDQGWQANPWSWMNAGQPPPPPQAGQIIVLKPGQTHSFSITFDDPLWFVLKQDHGRKQPPLRLTELTNQWGERFRFEYRPPDPAACADLPNARLIWHGRLPSRAFNVSGIVD